MTEAEMALRMHLSAGVNGLNALGYSIFRFSNNETVNDIENVLEKIKTKVEVLLQSNINKQK
jgi:very-short-patch-repair endonuclease